MATFHVEIVKPSHYDDDGYVLRWWKAWIPSNSMASLYAIAKDCAERRVLGSDTAIDVRAYDEMTMKVPKEAIVRRIRRNGGILCLVGVQSNQYPRALDLARWFRERGVPVAIGGFHVSGVLSMIKEPACGLQDALDLGCTLYAGEAEEHFEAFLHDAHAGTPEPVYNHMHDLPALQEAVPPILPESIVRRYDGSISSFDAGRGCPFQCSFCTIINVQGRKSRYRDADDIEKLIRANHAQDIHSFFVTDDNFARNKNWEAIYDRIIELKEREGIGIRFVIQVDTLAHKIPNFIEKSARAGCVSCFIGLESINAANLALMKKGQNRITEYRRMFQLWKEAGIITYAGYILGLPGDTPESLKHDIEMIQREMPVDLLEFTMLTPLPGSEDHQTLYNAGTWMDPDLNRYDLEHVTVEHPKMSREVWQQTYRDIYDWYYTDAHVETLLRRNAAYGIKPVKMWRLILQIYGAVRYEGIHPQQCGYIRFKDPTDRRPGFRRLPRIVHTPLWLMETARKYLGYAGYALKVHRMRKRVEDDPAKAAYRDFAITPVVDAEGEALEIFDLNVESRAAVLKARKQVQAREDAARRREEEKLAV